MLTSRTSQATLKLSQQDGFTDYIRFPSNLQIQDTGTWRPRRSEGFLLSQGLRAKADHPRSSTLLGERTSPLLPTLEAAALTPNLRASVGYPPDAWGGSSALNFERG